MHVAETRIDSSVAAMIAGTVPLQIILMRLLAALGVLRKQNLPHSLVALAGDIAAGDSPPNADGWHIAISAEKSGTPIGTLTVHNSTLAENEASVAGGGLYNAGNVTLTRVTFQDNLPDECVGCP